MPNITQKASTGNGVFIQWGAEHRDKDGNLICRPCAVPPPPPPTCPSPRCILRFFRDTVFSALLASYHARRVYYAEAMRYMPEAVDGHFQIRRAGINHETGQRYDYRPEVYPTLGEARVAALEIFDKVLERYRTGEPSPQTIWQAIHAIIKIKCPVCRRYNRDPFLFGRLR